MSPKNLNTFNSCYKNVLDAKSKLLFKAEISFWFTLDILDSYFLLYPPADIPQEIQRRAVIIVRAYLETNGMIEYKLYELLTNLHQTSNNGDVSTKS